MRIFACKRKKTGGQTCPPVLVHSIDRLPLDVGKQIFLRFGIPKAVVRFYDLIQLGKEQLGFAQLRKVRKRGQRQIDLRIDQLLSAGDFRQVGGCFHNAVQSTDVRNHRRRVEQPFVHHGNGLYHIRGCAVARCGNMRAVVVNVIEVHHGGKARIPGACKKVQAAVHR